MKRPMEDTKTTKLEEREHWLRLSLLPGLGFYRLQALVQRFGSLRNASNGTRESLLQIRGIGPALADGICDINQGLGFVHLQKRLEDLGIRYVTWIDSDYPEALRRIHQPPAVLYYKGALDLVRKPLLAVVGSRKIPGPLARWVEDLCAELAQRGLVIVSGLARGSDGAAHTGALRGGATIAVLGSGLNCIYPREHTKLAREMAGKGGLVLSEYAPDTSARPPQFPARNRIVAGLCHAVLVVAAGEKSGALITADFALEGGKEVMAVPGFPFHPAALGVNRLIQEGAKPVLNVTDVMEEFASYSGIQENTARLKSDTLSCSDRNGQSGSGTSETCFSVGEEILRKLVEPLSAGELLRQTKLTPAALSAGLSDLEVAGRIRCSPEGLWFRIQAG